MSQSSSPASAFGASLPGSLSARREGPVAFLKLSRPDKRNAINDEVVTGLGAFFETLPADIRCVVLHGAGEHFCAGLDLRELSERDVVAGMHHSAGWHRAFRSIEFGPVPVVSVLHGAVVGGGLELACATHVRVAERSAYYGLPEGQRGIFVGGGGAVRLPRLIGASRMMEMMLTGRTYDAEEGLALGFSHYVLDDGKGMAKATELANIIAANEPLTNFAIMHALPRIAEAEPATGYLLESAMAAIAQASPTAKARLQDFLAKRSPKVRPKRKEP